ncbi:MAG: pantetheine-phosphate adenylyltransferase [Succinivibrionaceae bacterium]|nr:pantetheine-phosphate adenylyltransferase [Succinivibrionaceae bacterium]
MTKAVFPGTFDPPTLGHLDLIARGATLFSEVVVAVAKSAAKDPLFSLEERCDLMRRCCQGLPQVSVRPYSGMTVDLLRGLGAHALLRGARSAIDFDYELHLSGMYRALLPALEVVILPTRPGLSFITSTLVRDTLRHQGDVSPFVPQEILADLRARGAGPA